jgi:thiol-disulfide isomerase/thioredoxin
MRLAAIILAGISALALSAQQPVGIVDRLAKEGHPIPEAWERHAELLGKPAPKLDLNTWKNGEVTPEDMEGKIVIVDFWATWCRPCIDAIPHNLKMAKKYEGKGILLIGICGSGRGEEQMGKVVKDKGVTYPVCHPGPGTTNAWRVAYWPTYGVIDRKGTLRALGIGHSYVEKIVDALLEEEAASEQKRAAEINNEVHRLTKEGHELPDVWPRHEQLLGRPAPALELQDWVGGAVSAEDMKGKIVVVDFWATWCPDCIEAIPLNNELAAKYAKDVVFIGACGSGRGEEKMAQLVGEKGMAYPTARTTKATTYEWQLAFWPTYGVIDREGTLRSLGAKPEYLGRIIDTLLAE